MVNAVFNNKECYKVDFTPCGNGLIYGGQGLGKIESNTASNFKDLGLISDTSKLTKMLPSHG